jgi:hypothetical protein
VGSEVVSYQQAPGQAVFLLDLSQLMLRGLDTNVLVVAHPTGNEEEEDSLYASLERHAEAAAAAHCLCFVWLLGDKAPSVAGLRGRLLDVVVLGGTDLSAQLASPAPQEALLRAILGQVKVGRLCPFDTTRPARGAMFVGRSEELRTLVQDRETAFLVSGARRVGKSSLLCRVHEVLRRRYEGEERVFLLPCETWHSFESAARQIAVALESKREERAGLGPQSLLTLLRRKSHRGRRPLVLIFDEFDNMAEADSRAGWGLAECLHSAVEGNLVQLIFCGFREVMRLKDSHASPFSEKLRTLRLPALDRDDVKSLFLAPFRRVGVHPRDPDAILRRVFHASAGHPFVVQFYGEAVFGLLARQNANEITPADIDAFERSFEFDDYIVSYFYENTRERERVLAFLLALSDQGQGWSEEDFEESLRNIDMNPLYEDIHCACRNLVLVNIFRFDDGRYDFVFPAFRRQIRQRYPHLSKDLKARYEKGEMR